VLERLTWIKQSTYRWAGDDLTIYVDSWGAGQDAQPADIVLITHAHGDHFDPDDIDTVRTDDTVFVAPRDVAKELSGEVISVSPGDTIDVKGIKGQAVPAYNIAEHRLDKHPKANGWVGYVLELEGNTFYFSGDTDALPELESVRTDVAFVCVGGDPFVMGPGEAAGLVRAMEPQLAVPNHYGWAVGTPANAETFQREAEPVKVEILSPVVPFEKT
jgi:L-ascorbate metabolism protein UlaG (beta-lactamase superfamily)